MSAITPADLLQLQTKLDALERRIRDIDSQGSGVREKLKAARTYYVRTDGNDANTGLVNTAAGAFLTIQRAINVVTQEIDPAGWGITIQIADGTYNVSALIALNPIFGSGTVTIVGNLTTPANVAINFTTSNSPGFYQSRRGMGSWYLRGMRLTGTTGTANGAITAEGGHIFFDNIEFNTGWLYHLIAQLGGTIYCLGNYAIIPTTITNHAVASVLGILQIANVTITLPANMVISNGFLSAVGVSHAVWSGNTVTNIATSTGSRGAVNSNSVVNLNGAAQTTIPGNANLGVASGGQVV